MSQEPAKPETVPAEAKWNASNKEWEIGQKNEKGQMVGEWKWWLAPNGHLCCHSFFDDQGKMISFKRFHPNGEVSQYGTVDGSTNKFKERVYIRSSEETTEIFPVADRHVWKAAARPGVPVSFDLFDKDGNQINGYTVPKDFDEYKKISAIQAFEKIGRTIDEAMAATSKTYEFLGDAYKPVFIQRISKEDIEIAEKRLNLKFPPSYVEFVLEHGLFKAGKDATEEHRMLHPAHIGRLSDELERYWDVDWDNYTQREQEIMDKIIYFSMGDEGLQMVWFFCFDYNTLNEKTGEVEILRFNQDDWQWMANDGDIKPYDGPLTSMHQHIVKMAKRINERVADERER